MRNLTHFAVLPLILGFSILVAAYASSAPPGLVARRDYANSLQQDFINKHVSNTIVWTSGPDNRQLYLDGPWLDHSTASALVSGGIARKAGRYGFDTVTFEVRKRAFE